MKKLLRYTLAVTTALVVCGDNPSCAEDLTLLGGEMTSFLPERHAIQVAAPNVTNRERFERQLSGFQVFHSLFGAGEGVGPTFVNNSCGGCHVNNGRGPAQFSRSSMRGSTMIVKVSLPGLNPDGSPRNVPGIGEQIQDHVVAGRPRFDMKLKWDPVPGKYPDGAPYTLRKPRLSFVLPGFTSRRVASSLRMTPALIGVGLIDAAAESTILEFADPADTNGDGISGEPQYVIDARTRQKRLGKFGFRAGHTTAEEQSAAAAFFDMGISSALFRNEEDQEELGADALDRLTVYQVLAGVPPARDQSDPKIASGRRLFEEVGCDDCHRMTMTTGEVPGQPELSNQTFHPFSDLLLHDMGPGLADRRSEFEASGREWRTTPLWGVGFSERLSAVKALFLHDGRARNVEEAILWHGGEAQKSKTAFMNLKKSSRDELIAFLRSL